MSYTEKEDVIREELQLCGYFCIITSEKMTAAQVLIHYKGRDISEKLFSADKSYFMSFYIFSSFDIKDIPVRVILDLYRIIP